MYEKLLWLVIDRNYDNMQSKAEKEEYLDMIKYGRLDIIVGTHSLLGSRVVYNNLGLLVVDEEQVCFSIFVLLIIMILLNKGRPKHKETAHMYLHTKKGQTRHG